MKPFRMCLFLVLFTFFLGIAFNSIWTLTCDAPKDDSPERTSTCNLLFLNNDSLDYKEIQNVRSQKQGLIAETLTRFKAVPLEKLAPCVNESYRLIIIPTSNYPVSIQLLRSNNDRILFVERLNGNDHAVRQTTERPTEQEWFEFKSLLRKHTFWDAPVLNDNKSVVKDEAIYIMEGIEGEKYHYIQRQKTNDELKEAADYLVRLSGIKYESVNPSF